MTHPRRFSLWPLSVALLIPFATNAMVEGSILRWITALALSGILLAAVYALSRERWRLIAALVLLAPAMLLTWAELTTDAGWLQALGGVTRLAFMAFATGCVFALVIGPGEVSADRLAGAVAVYLLLGIVWSMAYQLLELSRPGSLASATGAASPRELFYFSYVTLTTLGYGDVSPVSPLARNLAALEAVVGQMYVAILVARLVALYHREGARSSARLVAPEEAV